MRRSKPWSSCRSSNKVVALLLCLELEPHSPGGVFASPSSIKNWKDFWQVRHAERSCTALIHAVCHEATGPRAGATVLAMLGACMLAGYAKPHFDMLSTEQPSQNSKAAR